MKEICICAAIKISSGVVINGHRHSDCFHAGVAEGIDQYEMAKGEQGFTTSTGRFVSREEGRKLQDAAGIKSADKINGYTKNTLFSEDLY